MPFRVLPLLLILISAPGWGADLEVVLHWDAPALGRVLPQNPYAQLYAPPPAAADPDPALIYLERQGVPRPLSPKALALAFDEQGPMRAAYLAGQGARLELQNLGATYHRPYLLSEMAALRFGRVAPGQKLQRSLPTAKATGAVMVPIFCEDHPSEKAMLIIPPTPHSAWAAPGEGRLTFKGLAEGAWTLKAWHPLLHASSQEIRVGAAGARATLTFRGR